MQLYRLAATDISLYETVHGIGLFMSPGMSSKYPLLCSRESKRKHPDELVQECAFRPEGDSLFKYTFFLHHSQAEFEHKKLIKRESLMKIAIPPVQHFHISMCVGEMDL